MKKTILIFALLAASLAGFRYEATVRAFAPPTATSFATTVPVNAASPIALNGADVDGTALTFTTLSSPAHGALSLLNTSTGYLIYTPTASYTGSDSFTYKVTSGGEDSSTATVSITVTAARTTVIDTLVDGSGNPLKGTVSFVLTQAANNPAVAGTSPGGIVPVKPALEIKLNSLGQFSAPLTPSRSYAPESYYQLWYDGGTLRSKQFIALLDVPASTVSVNIAGTRVTDTGKLSRFVFASRGEIEAMRNALASGAANYGAHPIIGAGHTDASVEGVNVGSLFVRNAANQWQGLPSAPGFLQSTGSIPFYAPIDGSQIPLNLPGRILNDATISNSTINNSSLTSPAINGGSVNNSVVNNPTINSPTLAGSVSVLNGATVTGAVTATEFIGDGSKLTGIGLGGGDPNIAYAKNFGAVCNGSANDAAAIQAAINSQAIGGIVILPFGTCKVNSGLVLRKATRLFGQSKSGWDAIAGNTNVTVLDFTSLASNQIAIAGIGNASQVEIAYLRINGPVGNNGTIGIQPGLFGTGANIHHNFFYGFGAAIKIEYNKEVELTANFIEGAWTKGLWLKDTSYVTSISNNYANTAAGPNVYVEGCSAVNFYDPKTDEAFGANVASIQIASGSDISLNNTLVLFTHTGYGIRLGDATRSPTRVTLNNVRVQPFTTGYTAVNTILSTGSGHRFFNVTTTRDAGGDISDTSASPVYVNVNGTCNICSGTGGVPANIVRLSAPESIFVGQSAGGSTATGAGNTGIGTASLLSNATGSLNTALGYIAGGQSTATYSNNLFLGANTTPTGLARNNEANIAKSIFIASTSVDSARQAASPKVGISAPLPVSKFQINSDTFGSGIGTVSTSGTTVTGSGTTFTTTAKVGDTIVIAPQLAMAESRIVTAIASDTSLTVDSGFSVNAPSNSLYDLYRPRFGVEENGLMRLAFVAKPSGTTGNQTISAPAFSVNFAAGASQVIVSNGLATTDSAAICTVQNNDATLKSVSATIASGSITITGNATATSETRVYCELRRPY
jgi:hypothetical protein